MRYRANRTIFTWNLKSKLNSLVKISNTVLHDQRAYQNSITDIMVPWSVPRPHNPHNGLDPRNPALIIAGSDDPIISKTESRSNRRAQGCHITSPWCDVHGGDPASCAQYHQRPIWTGPTARVCSDNLMYCIAHCSVLIQRQIVCRKGEKLLWRCCYSTLDSPLLHARLLLFSTQIPKEKVWNCFYKIITFKLDKMPCHSVEP